LNNDDLKNKLQGKFIALDGPDGCGKTTQVQLTGGGSCSTVKDKSPISSIGIVNKSAKTSIPLPVPAAHLSFIKKETTFPLSSQRMALQSWPPISKIVRTEEPYIKLAPRAWQAISVMAFWAKGILTLP